MWIFARNGSYVMCFHPQGPQLPCFQFCILQMVMRLVNIRYLHLFYKYKPWILKDLINHPTKKVYMKIRFTWTYCKTCFHAVKLLTTMSKHITNSKNTNVVFNEAGIVDCTRTFKTKSAIQAPSWFRKDPRWLQHVILFLWGINYITEEGWALWESTPSVMCKLPVCIGYGSRIHC